MKNEKLINKIKSKYILNNIINYINDKNFQVKLFLYSEKYQERLNIKLIGLKENYLKIIRFDLNKYLNFDRLKISNIIRPNIPSKHKKTKNEKFEKNSLEIAFDNFLKIKGLEKDKIENIIFDIYNNKEIKDIDEEDINNIYKYEILINIYSPLFKILSKTKNFEKKFSIYICQKIIDDYKLQKDYIKTFNDLNDLKIKYTSIFYNLKGITSLKNLELIKIDFTKLKRLSIEFDDIIENNEEMFKNLFNNIKNNLEYFNISFEVNFCYHNNNYLLEEINNFKSLKYLYMKLFPFKKVFRIKLNTLKLFSLQHGYNVKIPNNNEKLKSLCLNWIGDSVIKFFKNANFKNLEILDLRENKISDIKILEKVNFKELKLLDLSGNQISDINVLENVDFRKLEILDLGCNQISDINILEKVKFKELKKLDLDVNKISDISVLENVDFKELKELHLMYNQISDINILEKVKFNKLKKIDLKGNKITNINVLENLNFIELKELNLSYNKISDINILEKVNFTKIETLNLIENKISENKIKKFERIKNIKFKYIYNSESENEEF